jgi:hypothetical protein
VNLLPEWSRKAGLAVADFSAAAFSSVGTTCVAVTAVYVGLHKHPYHHWWPGRAFIGAVVISGAGGLLGVREARNLRSLRKTVGVRDATLRQISDQLLLERQDFRARVRGYLSELAAELGMDHNGRITAYKHDVGSFAILARYSPNPDYNRRGRPFYSDTEGFIGKAWREGEAFAADLPDASGDLRAYAETLTHRGIGLPLEVLQPMKMKARCLAGFAIKDSKGLDPIAVVVFETMTPRGLSQGVIRGLLDGEKGLRLREYLNDSRALTPTPSAALERGF